MAKKITNPPAPPDNDEVAAIENAAYDSNVDDVPPHEEIPDSADVDYLPEDGDEGLVYEGGDDGRDHAGDEGDNDSLLSPEQFKSLRGTAERLRRSVSFMKCDDSGRSYVINDKNVTEAKALALPDLLITQRNLWIGNKSVETHGYFLTELKGKAPPRPNTFTNRARWKEYHKNGKESDPWGNITTILPFKTASGGIISFQANSAATRTAIGELLAAFIRSGGKRRPYVQFTSGENAETGQSFPVLRIVGWEDTNEDFSFLREMLIKDDPEFPEPEEKKFTGFEND